MLESISQMPDTQTLLQAFSAACLGAGLFILILKRIREARKETINRLTAEDFAELDAHIAKGGGSRKSLEELITKLIRKNEKNAD